MEKNMENDMETGVIDNTGDFTRLHRYYGLYRGYIGILEKKLG